ncbi:hypothetical protein ACFO3U_04380 [Flavobacterium ponti]|uniref:Uncharacterized protein n=1 Tax=Flavobacterium ponti TaxID=665133 RepID=A0ABV9P247_9FLAO
MIIDPDIININIIPENRLTLIEIENVSKIKNQNKYLKISLIIISMTVIIILFKNYDDNKISIIK